MLQIIMFPFSLVTRKLRVISIYSIFYINPILFSCPVFLLFLFLHLLNVCSVKLYFFTLSQIIFRMGQGRNEVPLNNKLSRKPLLVVMGASRSHTYPDDHALGTLL